MDLDGKRLLVIGGAGFIGSHLVERLLTEDVAEVRVYDNFSRGRRESLERAPRHPRSNVFAAGGEILHRDVLAAAMDGIDGVFHLAALWLMHCQEFPRAAFEVNVTGTLNVLEACLQAGVCRLVFSSSASVYGDAVEEPMTEEHPYRNTTVYGATKIAGEMLCRALHHRSRGSDRPLEYVGLRYMNVYGPRQDDLGAYGSVVTRILGRLDRSLPPIVYGDGSQSYDFVFVDDCAEANVLAMKADMTDAFYNVGTGTKTSIRDVADLLMTITGKEIPIRFEPAGSTFVTNRVGCPDLARAELSFESQVMLRQGLARLIEWRRGREVPAQNRACT